MGLLAGQGYCLGSKVSWTLRLLRATVQVPGYIGLEVMLNSWAELLAWLLS